MELGSMGPQRVRLLSTALLVVVALGVLIWQIVQHGPPGPPDFAEIPAGEARKTAFFDYLRPIIVRENAKRMVTRKRLLALRGGSVGRRDAAWLAELAVRHELPAELTPDELIERLLLHVDTIPVSMALAQAAKESAWGTSRFAVEGNNYFGQRCWEPGCGMVPLDRKSGGRFEVRRFDSVEASVSSYLVNINTHPDYAPLRDYRAHQRKQGESISGIELAEKMAQYSERREHYVDEIQSLIHFNKLDRESHEPDREP